MKRLAMILLLVGCSTQPPVARQPASLEAALEWHELKGQQVEMSLSMKLDEVSGYGAGRTFKKTFFCSNATIITLELFDSKNEFNGLSTPLLPAKLRVSDANGIRTAGFVNLVTPAGEVIRVTKKPRDAREQATTAPSPREMIACGIINEKPVPIHYQPRQKSPATPVDS